MNVVIYTGDFEPITVLDLPVWLLDILERVGVARVAVAEPPRVTSAEDPISIYQPKIVNIYCERLRWKDGTTKPILITPDEELALLLRPEWLPGQRQAINHYKETIRGFQDLLIKHMRGRADED
jgi:hypothetical protein